MLPKIVVIVAFVCFLRPSHCDTLSKDGDEPDSTEDYLLKHIWNNWRPQVSGFGNVFPGYRGIGAYPPTKNRDVEETTEKDREPLSPDFKDPKGAKSETPTHSSPEESDFGVVDIPAGGGSFGGSFGGFPPASGGGFPVFNQFPGGLFNLFGSISRQKPWWKGPNVCTEKDEIIESPEGSEDDEEDSADDYGFFSNINFSTCEQTPTKYECTTKVRSRGSMKTFVVKYKCCHGYQRQPDESGCTKLELKSMAETCADLAGQEFNMMVKSSGLEEKISADNITVFVPSDQALKDFSEQMLELNQVEIVVPAVRKRRDLKDGKNAVSSKDLVMSHMVAGIIELSDVSNDHVLHSDYHNSTIRINKYPTPSEDVLTTANCIRVSKKDNFATNGIAHMLEGVLTPVTQTISQIIGESNKFTVLRQILEKSELDKLLDSGKVFTLFAPNDAAFEKLPAAIRTKLMRGDSCAKNILKHHIVSHSVCSNAISMNASTHNIEDNAISLRRDDDNNLIIDNAAKVIEADVMATNGIIHVIDTILMPESGLDINEMLGKRNLSAFQNLVKNAGLTELIDDLKNVTLFVPSDDAMKDAADEIEKIKNDKDKILELIMYHTVKGELKSCDFKNDALLKTGNSNEKLRLNLYNTLPFFKSVFNRATLNCAKMINVDEQACGSVVHEINKVLVPPKKTVIEMIKDNTEYEVFAKLMKGTELEKELESENGSFTVLAPKNDAFLKLPEKVLQKYMDDKEKADQLLRNHVLPDVVCCSGVGFQSFPFTERVRTLGTQSLQQMHDGNGRVRFGDAVVTDCDNVGINGIIHTINKVIQPVRRSPNPFEDLGLVMFNL